jgi:hypothetical protein
MEREMERDVYLRNAPVVQVELRKRVVSDGARTGRGGTLGRKE